MTADLNPTFGLTVTATKGRDNGKTFGLIEVPPIEMATFVLRLLAAIRLEGVQELRLLVERSTDDSTDAEEHIDVVLRLLAGCDPEAVRALMIDALKYVRVAADPRHPGMFRPLLDDDIRELATLGLVLGAFAKSQVVPGL